MRMIHLEDKAYQDENLCKDTEQMNDPFVSCLPKLEILIKFARHQNSYQSNDPQFVGIEIEISDLADPC